MLINEVGGVNIKDDTFATAPTVKELYRAGGAIAIGSAVLMEAASSAGTSTGSNVIVAPTGAALYDATRFCGIYTGIGGTGATATVANGSGTVVISGKAAVSGDMVLVVQKGMTYAVADAAVTDVTALRYGTSTAGRLRINVAAPTDTNVTQPYTAISLEAASGAGVAFRVCLK